MVASLTNLILACTQTPLQALMWNNRLYFKSHHTNYDGAVLTQVSNHTDTCTVSVATGYYYKLHPGAENANLTWHNPLTFDYIVIISAVKQLRRQIHTVDSSQ